MGRLLAVLAFAFLPGLLHAQEATLAAPETVTAPAPGTKLRVVNVNVSYAFDNVTLQLIVLKADGTVHRALDPLVIVDDPGTTAVNEYRSLLAAMGTAEAGETGGVERRGQFRILTWLKANVAAYAGITVTP